MTKLLVLALCVCLGMSMSVKERLEKSEALNESAESQEECDPSLIGNGYLDWACCNLQNNWDGGDCCSWLALGDGWCNPECNFQQHSFDSWDCIYI